jgi:uncharacterized membrane protein (UPF0127 family)
MMKRLISKTHGRTLVENLEVAESLWGRLKGLLGRRDLALDRGLWITRCNSVHTFLMNFAIDLVFVDDQLIVVKTVRQVDPGRIIWPVWRARSVIELRGGFLDQHRIEVGEELHVDHSLS